MKRANEACYVLPLYEAVLTDAALYIGAPLNQFDHEIKTLNNQLEHRGVTFICVDLPKFGKIFDKGLSSGYLQKWPRTLGNLNGLPKFLNVLISLVFDESRHILHDVDPNIVLYIRQICYMYKKLRKDSSDEAAKMVVSEFFEIDSGLRHPTLGWHDRYLFDPSDLASAHRQWSRCDHSSVVTLAKTVPMFPDDKSMSSSALLSTVQFVADVVISSMPKFDPMDIVPRHGPGAVADLKSGEDKYRFPVWPTKLEDRFPISLFGFHTEEQFKDTSDEVNTYEVPSKLIVVPKTVDKPRLIASEPTSHQYIQQGVMKWLRDWSSKHVLQYCIEFNSQQPNRDAALMASISGSAATIDLSSASDRLSCYVVERIFRRAPTFLEALHACRTQYVYNPIDASLPRYLHLRKFAPMGSAVTFPVQSIIYAIVAIACLIYEEGLPQHARSIRDCARRVRVFGDDLIVPNHVAYLINSVMRDFQLKLNMEKTHYSGYFRESCGMDAYKGHDVTPVYIHELTVKVDEPRSFLSWVAVRNNSYLKGLWRLASAIEGLIPTKIRKRIFRGYSQEGHGSIRYLTHLRSPFNLVGLFYNPNLQVWERKEFFPILEDRMSVRADNGKFLEAFSSLDRKVDEFQYLDLSTSELFLQSARLRLVVRRVPC